MYAGNINLLIFFYDDGEYDELLPPGLPLNPPHPPHHLVFSGIFPFILHWKRQNFTEFQSISANFAEFWSTLFHQKLTNISPKFHYKLIEISPKLHHKLIKISPKIDQKLTKNWPKFHQNFIINWSKFHKKIDQKWTKNGLQYSAWIYNFMTEIFRLMISEASCVTRSRSVRLQGTTIRPTNFSRGSSLGGFQFHSCYYNRC